MNEQNCFTHLFRNGKSVGWNRQSLFKKHWCVCVTVCVAVCVAVCVIEKNQCNLYNADTRLLPPRLCRYFCSLFCVCVLGDKY